MPLPGDSIDFPGLSPYKEEWSFHPSCNQNRISWSPLAGLTTHRTASSFKRSSTSATAVHVPPSFDMRNSYQNGLLHRLWWIQPSAQVFQDQNIHVSWRNPPQVGSKFSGIRNPVGWGTCEIGGQAFQMIVARPIPHTIWQLEKITSRSSSTAMSSSSSSVSSSTTK